jgi:L-alanine-DL-glutamate epimerase-like enolase superfamily enzyme
VRITDVKLTPVSHPVPFTLRWGRLARDTVGGILVQVYTDEGITGLGEFEAPYAEAHAVLEHQVLPRICGRNPLHVARLWDELYPVIGGRPDQMLGGLDVALWDILGQACGQPIYRLLGGSETPIPVYIAPSMKQPEVIAQECVRFRAEGHRAIKLRVGLGQVGLDEPGSMRKDLQIVEDARRILGDDFVIGVDTDKTYDRAMALQMGERLHDLDAAWFEEPLQARERTAYVQEIKVLKGALQVPLSGAQGFHTRFEFAEIVSQRAVDIVQPDCARCGGITELLRIAALASTWGLSVMPHVGCGCGYDVRVVATAHVLASITNGMWLCYPAYDTPLRSELLTEPPVVTDGRLALPQGPGLGIELDQDALARYRVAG